MRNNGLHDYTSTGNDSMQRRREEGVYDAATLRLK